MRQNIAMIIIVCVIIDINDFFVDNLIYIFYDNNLKNKSLLYISLKQLPKPGSSEVIYPLIIR